MHKQKDSLVFVTDRLKGWRRVARGCGFIYIDQKGKRICDPAALDRIRLLAIPPAYTNVWICPLHKGHLQATGRDAKGRKQYRYHAAWKKARDQVKFERLKTFALMLPAIRRRVQYDLTRKGTTLKAVLAAIVRILDTTALRVGNDKYSKHNDSYGLTTLRDRHAQIQADTLKLKFRGKSGVTQQIEITNQRIARIARRCQELPGQRLFQYINDEGKVQPVRSEHVNAYLHSICSGDFTAKDFRTWHASVLALELILHSWRTESKQDSIETTALTLPNLVNLVATSLGNTGSVCRKYYIHPAVLALCGQSTSPPNFLFTPRKKSGLHVSECALLQLLSARDQGATLINKNQAQTSSRQRQ
ncbi:MAG: DNA topoisomerase IB [Acidovorax sp.]